MIAQGYVDAIETDINRLITELKSMNPEDAKKQSKEALIRMGVLDENGRTKKQIVTGDFFGW